MRIAVCVTQVPDATEIETDPVHRTLAGIPGILSPFDRSAVGTALRLKKANGGTVTVISAGPSKAKAVLREAVSMGADEAYLVTDRAFGDYDTYATSYIFSQVIRKLGPFEVILEGKKAIDGDAGQTAPGMAEHLGVVHLENILDLKVEGTFCIARRQVENGIEIVKAQFPVLCTVAKASNKSRSSTIKKRPRLLRMEIGEIHLADLSAISPLKIASTGSPIRSKAIFTPQRGP